MSPRMAISRVAGRLRFWRQERRQRQLIRLLKRMQREGFAPGDLLFAAARSVIEQRPEKDVGAVEISKHRGNRVGFYIQLPGRDEDFWLEAGRIARTAEVGYLRFRRIHRNLFVLDAIRLAGDPPRSVRDASAASPVGRGEALRSGDPGSRFMERAARREAELRRRIGDATRETIRALARTLRVGA